MELVFNPFKNPLTFGNFYAVELSVYFKVITRFLCKSILKLTNKVNLKRLASLNWLQTFELNKVRIAIQIITVLKSVKASLRTSTQVEQSYYTKNLIYSLLIYFVPGICRARSGIFFGGSDLESLLAEKLRAPCWGII
jgi:hypothetical protein